MWKSAEKFDGNIKPMMPTGSTGEVMRGHLVSVMDWATECYRGDAQRGSEVKGCKSQSKFRETLKRSIRGDV